ncbi:MAG: inositol monophosphatase [Ruminococcaceae bacterium]|nr:inositol monophosphatase [Oscillospiraceae bacterium]
MLNTVVEIVKKAAAIMTGGEYTVSEKGDANFVTDKDVAVERFLREELTACFDGIGFVGEEEDFAADALSREYTAVVDPIDGTMNFTRDMNLSVISVAILKNGKPHIGVVYNPFTNEMFTAQRGKGAFLNGKRIRVSDRALKSACFFTAWSTYKKDLAKACFNISEEVYYDTCDIRRLGVCALELSYMAAGRGELYFEIRLFPWDFAAAGLILTEAGGYIGTIDFDDPIYTRPQPIIAANSKENFDYLMAKVKKYVPHIPYEE